MAYDRPSWRDIDKMRDGSGGRKQRKKERKDIKEHSTRYDKYKSDLNRLFDQGMAGELLKKPKKEKEPEPEAAQPAKAKGKAKAAVTTRKGPGRIPKSTKASTSRLRLIRTIVDTTDRAALLKAVDEIVESFGLPDDWEVLVRVLEHDNEDLVLKSVLKMKNLLAVTAKVPRRATLKERLRTIGQTAGNAELREIAAELEEKL